MEGATRLWKADGMEAAAERIERRLVEETSKVCEEIAGVKTALVETEGRLRVEIGESEGRLRVELAGMDNRFERRLSDVRFDLVKWSFVFWLGQVVTMTAILSAMLNTRG